MRYIFIHEIGDINHAKEVTENDIAAAEAGVLVIVDTEGSNPTQYDPDTKRWVNLDAERFVRENRYFVFKKSHMNSTEIANMERFSNTLVDEAKPTCVVVEEDWPEYEPTWSAIEKRTTGKDKETA